MISFFPVFKDYLKRTVLEMPLDCDISDSSFSLLQLALIIAAAVIWRLRQMQTERSESNEDFCPKTSMITADRVTFLG